MNQSTGHKKQITVTIYIYMVTDQTLYLQRSIPRRNHNNIACNLQLWISYCILFTIHISHMYE